MTLREYMNKVLTAIINNGDDEDLCWLFQAIDNCKICPLHEKDCVPERMYRCCERYLAANIEKEVNEDDQD